MLFFIDESGHDRQQTPYEVLAAVSIAEGVLWEFIQAERKCEEFYFGTHLSDHRAELKGSKLLKKKRFRHATQRGKFSDSDRAKLAKSFLEKGGLTVETKNVPLATAQEYTAFGQASLAFVDSLLDIAIAFNIKVFASMIDPHAVRPTTVHLLRKDYVYLFERMYYYLEDLPVKQQGLLVFDEIEKVQSRILLSQVSNYFLKTMKGKARSKMVVPEPFFVHSDLTTLVQLADLVAYIINWSFRKGSKMTGPIRSELSPYASKVDALQYKGRRSDPNGETLIVFGVTCLHNLT